MAGQWRYGADAALLRQHRRADASSTTLDRLLLGAPPGAAPYPDVRADGGCSARRTSIRPRSIGGPTRSARRSRMPRSLSSAPTARSTRRGGELVHRGARARILERSRAHGRALPPHSGPRRLRGRGCRGRRHRRGGRGFLYFVGGGRDDQDVRLRVSPTEVEEAAYSTGSCATRSRSEWTRRAACRARRRDERRRLLGRTDRRLKRDLPRTCSPLVTRDEFHALRTASSTARCFGSKSGT